MEIEFFDLKDSVKYILIAIATNESDFHILRNHLKRETGSEIKGIDFLCYSTSFFGYEYKVVRVSFLFNTKDSDTFIEASFRRDAYDISAGRYFTDDNGEVRKIKTYGVVDGKIETGVKLVK